MATQRSSTNKAASTAKSAGKPATPANRSRAGRMAAAPSAEELDLRDRLKAGPRRPGGPPLVGDTLSRASLDALRNEVVPEPTDPTNRRTRK